MKRRPSSAQQGSCRRVQRSHCRGSGSRLCFQSTTSALLDHLHQTDLAQALWCAQRLHPGLQAATQVALRAACVLQFPERAGRGISWTACKGNAHS
jgi:hypothetical protein